MGLFRFLFGKKSSGNRNTSSKPTTFTTSHKGRTFGSGENVNTWVSRKKASGSWLSPDDYRRKTGKPGRRS